MSVLCVSVMYADPSSLAIKQAICLSLAPTLVYLSTQLFCRPLSREKERIAHESTLCCRVSRLRTFCRSFFSDASVSSSLLRNTRTRDDARMLRMCFKNKRGHAWYLDRAPQEIQECAASWTLPSGQLDLLFPTGLSGRTKSEHRHLSVCHAHCV